MSAEKVQRQSNIELLRIVGMLMMIANHYLSGSGFSGNFDYSDFSGRMFFFQCYGVWGKTLVNTFVIITGYFMCKRTVTVGRWLQLFMRGKFYLIAFYIIFLFAGLEAFTFGRITEVLFAEILDINKGYTYSFLCVYLLIPFCNVLLERIDEKRLKILLILSMTIYAVPAWLGNTYTFNYVAWYVVMYFVGAYIRLYGKRWMDDSRKLGGVLAVSFILAFISIAIIDIFGVRHEFYKWDYLIRDNSSKPFAIIIGILLFLFFKNLKIKQSAVINKIASTTYGVLWLHTATPIWRNFMWNNIFHVNEHYYDVWWTVPIYAVGVTLTIFVCAALIDMLYAEIIEKPVINKIHNYDWYSWELWGKNKKNIEL